MKMIREYIMPGALRDAFAYLMDKPYDICLDITYSDRALILTDRDGQCHAVLWLELDAETPTWHTVLVTGRHRTGQYDTEDLTLIESLIWALDIELTSARLIVR
jgi:hypothetical protein